MSEILSEANACDLLADLFQQRGFAIKRNCRFREYGVSFHIDGWDAAKRVGFEFLTSEQDDHDDLSLDEYQTLMAAQQRGELAILILDEGELRRASKLAEVANAFLNKVQAAPRPKRAAARVKQVTKKVVSKVITKAAKKKAQARKRL